jgi:mono/diheme cytochrome c family protein
MTHSHRPIFVACLLGCALAAADTGRAAAPAETAPGETVPGETVPATEHEKLFVRRIAPLLAAKCAACHGADAATVEGGLSLATHDAALRGGDSGTPAILPGDAAASPLTRAVRRDDAEVSAMPPKESERLTAREIGWLEEWVAAGAAWPAADRVAAIRSAHEAGWTAEDGVTVRTSGGLAPDWDARRYDPASLWAYRPVVKPAVPEAPAGTHPIDAFLAARLPQGLKPAPSADRRTLLRRVTFDLTGLPPTPAEVDAFLADGRDDAAAFSAVIERLLASPHHGERMAQHWLDVTRYADSSGFSNDYERGNAWRYRDYVVRAFNADMPFDRFVREQIAGDEIDPADPEKLVATGFLRMGPWELTGMEVEKIARQRFLDDVVNAVGETFLAHSLQCARCHDHKFDPVPTRDYYAIQAAFATTQLVERAAPFLPGEHTGGFAERAALEQARAEHVAALDRLDATLLDNAARWFVEQGKDPARWNAAVAEARRRQEEQATSGKRRRPYADIFADTRRILTERSEPEADYPPKLVGLSPDQLGLERVARKGLERLVFALDRYEPYALAVYAGRTREFKTIFTPLRVPDDRLAKGELEATAILVGGDPFSPGPPVTPGVLSAVGGLAAVAAPPIPTEIDGRRRAFAEWVASPANPLTARAIVNRVWMWHFGTPLAGNPNNFGGTGKKPTHPELLDWLAATFVEQGSSLKSLHRLILGTAAYRRGAKHPDPRALATLDPLGTSYAVFQPRRLSAEELRDAMLAATGELNPQVGGIPNRPEINIEVALQPRQVMGTFAAAWVPNPRPAERHRRSLYALRLRGLGDPAMEVFNAPGPDFSCERRDATTVTPQVFALFNGRASHARALALAARVLRESGDDAKASAQTPPPTAARDAPEGVSQENGRAIDRSFALVYGRPATPDERAACIAHWVALEAEHTRISPRRVRPPLEVHREAVEENTGETFSFVETLHANAEFVPDLEPADCDARTRALADVCLVLFNTNEFAYVD